MKNKLGFLLIIIGSIICLIATLIVGFDFEKLSSGNIIKESFEFENKNQDINIENEFAQINIITHNLDNIIVDLEYLDRQNIDVENDIYLNIDAYKSYSWFSFGINFLTPTINIYVPKDYNGNLNINSNVGVISIKNLNIPKLTIENDVSTVSINDVTTSYLNIKSDVGGIIMEDVVSTEVSVITNVGSIEFASLSSDDIYIKTEVGNIVGSISGNTNDFTKIINTAIGESNISSSIEGDKYLEINSEIGSVNIDFTN